MGHTAETRKRDLLKRRQRRFDWLQENGPCSACGSWEKLEVDHVNETEKISHNFWSWSEEKRAAEAAKCQVLCENCHKKKTAPYLRKMHFRETHGNLNGYLRKACRCSLCIDFYKEWRRKKYLRTGN